jgi:hypothetical protein
MIVEPARDWNVFKQIFVDHWQRFKQFRPRYDTPYYESLVEKMLDCGNPDKWAISSTDVSTVVKASTWCR